MASVLTAGIATATAIAGSVAAGAAASVIVASAVTTFVVSMATAAISKSRYSDTETYNSEVSGSQTIIKSPTASVKMLYGETVVSGVLVYSGVSGTNNEFLHLVLTLAGHEVDEIGTVFFDSKAEFHEDISPYVSIARFNGGENQIANPLLLTDFGEWTESHRLRGLAYVHIRIERNDEVFTQVPNIKAIVRGRKVIDTRITDYDKQTALEVGATTELSFTELSYKSELLRDPYYGGDKTKNNGFQIAVTMKNTTLAGDKIIFAGDFDDIVASIPKSAGGCFWYDNAEKSINARFENEDGTPIVYQILEVELDLTKDFVSIVYYGGIGKITFLHNDRLEEFTIAQGLTFRYSTIIQKTDVDTQWVSFTSGVLLLKEDIDIIRFGDEIVDDALRNYGNGGIVSVTPGTATIIQNAVSVEDYHRAWSKNASLNIFDYMIDSRYGFSVAFEDMDLTAWELASDISSEVKLDEENPCPAQRYTVDGVVDTQQKVGNNLSQMLTGCAGVVIWHEGKFELKVAAGSEPVMTITSSMIHGSVVHRCVNSKASVFNTVKSVFVSGFNNWQSAETPLYRDEAAIEDDGEEILTELDLPFTDNLYIAQRLAITNLNVSRLEGGLSIFCSQEVKDLKAHDVVNVHNPESGIDNEKFRVAEKILHPTTGESAGGFELILNQHDNGAYDINEEDIIPREDIEEPIVPDEYAPVESFIAYSDSTTIDTTTGEARVFLAWDLSTNVRTVGYTITASILDQQSYSIEIAGRLVADVVDATPSVGQIVTYSIVANRDDGIKSDAVVVTHTVNDGSGGIATPTNFEIIEVLNNNGVAVWTENPSSEVTGSELRIGDNWRLSAFLGFSALSPLATTVSGFDYLSYLLADADENLIYSEPATAEATPNPDWFNPAYSTKFYRFSERGNYNVFEENAVTHYTGAIVPMSGKLASEQDYETFDIFSEDRGDYLLAFVEIETPSPDTILQVGGLAFSTLQQFGYPDRDTKPAKVQLVYWEKIEGAWGNPIEFEQEYTALISDSGQEAFRFGVKNNQGIESGFSTDILLRVGTDA